VCVGLEEIAIEDLSIIKVGFEALSMYLYVIVYLLIYCIIDMLNVIVDT